MEFFKDNSIRKELLRLLDEDELVRRKVRELVGEGGTCRTDYLSGKYGQREVSATAYETEKELTAAKAELAKYRAQVEELLRQKNNAEEKGKELEKQLLSRTKLWEEDKAAYLAKMEQQKDELSELRDKCQELEQLARQKGMEIDEIKEQLERSESSFHQMQCERERIEKQLAEQEQELGARFPRGAELFAKYPQISAATRKSLERVFVRDDDFAAFICCGAQSDSLEELWDIMQECWEKRLTSDLRILQELFAYALALANKSRSIKIFELLEVKPGDKYERREQLLEPDSVSQGRVHEVCVQGFRNAKTGKVIRQSLVNLE